MMGVKQGDRGQQTGPAGIINLFIVCDFLYI